MNINPVHEIPNGAIHLPGIGMTSIDELAASRAVAEYDAGLVLGHRTDVNEWVVFVKEGPDGPFPVLGLGSRLPAADEIKRRLYKSDVRRHGYKLVEQINRANEQKRLSARADAEAKIEHAADHLAFATRQEKGEKPKIYVPGRRVE